MATVGTRESAKIYQFPVRPRSNVGPSRFPERERGEVVAQLHRRVDFGSGWYHDAAIQDDRDSKN